MTVKPIHVAAIDGAPIRFYPPLSDDGGPDIPWVDDGDLIAALTRSGTPYQVLLEGIPSEAFGEILVTAGDDGLILMMPPRLAWRLVVAQARSAGTDLLQRAYLRASFTALDALTASLPPQDARAYTTAALNRWCDPA